MTLHLIKLAVGAECVEDIRAFQDRRRAGAPTVTHPTRHAPKRADALLAGGSLYWVVRGVIRARQRLVGIEPRTPTGPCLLVLDPALVETVPRAHRPFQGWRYLKGEDAPADADGPGSGCGASEELPEEMAAELAKLGLL